MAVQVKPEQAYAYAELLEILSCMEDEYTSKIPKKLIAVFKENASDSYKKHIDVTKPLEEQEISQKTAALIGMLTLQYWCESEEQKQELINIFKENERIYQENLRKKYNPDNIFNNNPSKEDIAENMVEDLDERLGEIDEIDKVSEEERIKTEEMLRAQALEIETRHRLENASEQKAQALIDYNNFAWYKKIFTKIKVAIFNLFRNFKKSA